MCFARPHSLLTEGFSQSRRPEATVLGASRKRSIGRDGTSQLRACCSRRLLGKGKNFGLSSSWMSNPHSSDLVKKLLPILQRLPTVALTAPKHTWILHIKRTKSARRGTANCVPTATARTGERLWPPAGTRQPPSLDIRLSPLPLVPIPPRMKYADTRAAS